MNELQIAESVAICGAVYGGQIRCQRKAGHRELTHSCEASDSLTGSIWWWAGEDD